MKKVCVYVCVSRRIHNVWHVIMIFVVVGLWSWIYLESSRTGSENALPPRGKNRELYVTMRANVIDAARPTNQSTRPNPPKAAHGKKYKCVMSSREEAEEAPPLAHLLCLLRPSVHRVVPVR